MAKLPISDFLETTLLEQDPTFEVRKGTAFNDLFFKPMEYITQPFRDEADRLFIAQSMSRILKTDDPDAFDEVAVDELVANFYVYRNEGGKSSGVARVYFVDPVHREYPTNGFVVVGNNGLNYSNPAAYLITQSQMSSQVEDGHYYMDVPVVSEDFGTEANLPPQSLVSVLDDTQVISVTNVAPISGGVAREKNTALISRAKNSISVRDLVTGKGFSATLFENFPNTLLEVQAVGFGDDEMMRDIVSNVHIGGRHDGYIKTPAITTTYKDIIGIEVDSTRTTLTTTQLQLNGLTPVALGEIAITNTPAAPVVMQVQDPIAAVIYGTADLSTPQVLGVTKYVQLSIDGVTKIVNVQGKFPNLTTRSEILAKINSAFGINVVFIHGDGIKVVSPNPGIDSIIELVPYSNPSQDAATTIFGFASGTALGDGPLTFQDTYHYTIDSSANIQRVLGPLVTLSSAVGTITGNLLDAPITEPSLFQDVQQNDIITITGIPGANGDYRVLEKISDAQLKIDYTFLAPVVIDSNYVIRHTGIKDGELVRISYYFNPLSIDIGKYIKLDTYGRERGVRPGREPFTITDVCYLRTLSIEVIDGVTLAPMGQVLDGNGGFGVGGFGQGLYGVGSGAEYHMVINDPTARFSAFEDAYIVVNPAYIGMSLRVHYECVPELEDIHNFCRSDLERTLDGDILVKHFLPAYVSGTIVYEADPTDSSIPTNDELTVMVKEFISSRPSNSSLQISDINQFIFKTIDPSYRYKGQVKTYTLQAVIHNTNGSTTIVESSEILTVPKESPFPKYTEAPLSPKITHWMADNIVLVRA